MTHPLVDIHRPICRFQLAFKGEWETSLHVANDFPPAADVAAWLSRGESDLALEAFYKVAAGEAFVGLRLVGLERARQHDTASQLIGGYRSEELTTIGSLIQRADALLSTSLFKTRASFLELGKVNAWLSFGPITFWTDQNGGEPLDRFDEALTANPRYIKPSTLPYAVELGFDDGVPHWLGLPVSEQSGSEHVISRALASDILSAL